MKKLYKVIFLFFFFLQLHGQDLYDLNTLRTIYIEFENPDWDEILTDNWYAQNGERELATLEMDGIVYDSVAIRYKGNATFFVTNENLGSPKKPLNIDMDDYISDQDLLGFNKVKLPNGIFDPTITRDVIGMRIYGDYMPSPEANWMKVYIGGEYIGLYPNTESINKSFLKKHFDYKKGVLFKCDPSSQFGSNVEWESPDLAWYGQDSTSYYNRYTLKSDYGWAEMVKLIDVLNNSPEDLEEVLNIDRVLWYLAVSTVIANYDSYNGFYIHNYYLYQHENGLFQILPWDVSESFVGALLGFSGGMTNDEIYAWDIFNENDPFGENRPLVDYVANHPTYRNQSLAHIRTVIEEVLDEDDLLNTLEDMQSITAAAVSDDPNDFLGLFYESNLISDANFFGFRVAGIISAVEKRKAYLQNHPEVSLVPPSISEVDRSPALPQVGEQTTITAAVENGTQVDLMITKNDYASHFMAIPMLDDGMHGDGNAGDGIYGAFVPYTESGDIIKYYIRAQNKDAMMLDPQRAEFEFHEYEVGQTVAVNDLKDNHPFSISPNPFSDIVTIQLSNLISKHDILSRIYDAKGILVHEENTQIDNGLCLLNLDHLNSGIYFIQLGDFKALKIVKM